VLPHGAPDVQQADEVDVVVLGVLRGVQVQWVDAQLDPAVGFLQVPVQLEGLAMLAMSPIPGRERRA